MKNQPLFWAGLALFGFLVVSNAFFVVDQRETAVMFQLGELRGQDYEPGLHPKLPFFQDVRKFDRRTQTLDNQTQNFLTGEKKNVEVDYYVKWRIADAATYYRATGGQELVARDRLASIVNRGMRDEFGSRTIKQVVSDHRDIIIQELTQDAASKVKDLGIFIVDVRIKSINLPKEVSDSVYDRMRAERTRVASDLRARGAEEAEKIRAEADREAQVTLANAYKTAEEVKGAGDAKAADVYAAAYGKDAEFYSFYRSLSVYRDAFAGSGNVMVIEPDGPLFKHFKGAGGP
ncbi:MAG TPA: protease modulator HflC [Solimonas sp.]